MVWQPEYRTRLKQKMLEQGFTRDILFAKMTGVPGNKLSRYLHGWEFPNEKDMLSMTRCLKVKRAEFIDLL